MAYGTETRSEQTAYRMAVTNTTTGLTATITVMFDSNQPSTEAQRDAIFQAFLTRVSTLAATTVQSASKNGGYSTPVTP